MADWTQADEDACNRYAQVAPPEEAARYRAELYRARVGVNTGAAGMFTGWPKYAVIALAIWYGVLETVEKLPQIALSYPRYEGNLAQIEQQKLQPDLLRAQITKADNEAKASDYQVAMTQAQLEKAKNDAEASKYQIATAASQAMKLEAEAVAAASPAMDFDATRKMETALDILDPIHPMLMRRGLTDPTLRLAQLMPALQDYQNKVAQDAIEKKRRDDQAAELLAKKHKAEADAKIHEAAVQEAIKSTDIILNGCRNKRIAGELKNYTASVACSAQRIIEVWQAINYEHIDVIELLQDKRVELAKKIDAGLITEAQMGVEYVKYRDSFDKDGKPITPTQVEQSADYTTGMNWRNKWEGYVIGLDGDSQNGAKWYAGVRSDSRHHECTEDKGASSAEFKKGCEGAVPIFVAVDKYNKLNADFRAGWNYREHPR